MAALCEMSGVSHAYAQPNGPPVAALAEVSMSVQDGEIVALLGPSGCGKSTLLRILAGLVAPTRGALLYHGAQWTGLVPGVALVFQSFALFPWLTVSENVRTALVAAGYSKAQIRERAEEAVALVGLSGSEEAYPRELSGGMKQRVGLARALSLDPEMLFMDEPFSQVDALTAEALRAEVLDIWAARDANLRSIVLVSHDIKEVATMADRILVMSAGPGTIRTTIDNTLPRPRNQRSSDFLQLIDRLHDVIAGGELPDVATPERAETVEPLPYAHASDIVGLLEYLDARGGREDLFRIAAEANREFGELIAIVKAAEMLDFVDTPRRVVLLEPLGVRFVRAEAAERASIWRRQLLELALFKRIADKVQQDERHAVGAEQVIELIAQLMPHERYERAFEVFVGWARYGDLFAYDEDARVLQMQ